jgi:hypothetical protein
MATEATIGISGTKGTNFCSARSLKKTYYFKSSASSKSCSRVSECLLSNN